MGLILAESTVHIICGNECGFVVHERYFEEKNRFTPGICPNCGAPTHLVHPYTTEIHDQYVMDNRNGRVSPVNS